jgi:hypothetical protein
MQLYTKAASFSHGAMLSPKNGCTGMSDSKGHRSIR